MPGYDCIGPSATEDSLEVNQLYVKCKLVCNNLILQFKRDMF